MTNLTRPPGGPMPVFPAGQPVDLAADFETEVQATVTAGPASSPNAGTVETWTVTSTGWPPLESGEQIYAVEAAQLDTDPGTFELVAVTADPTGVGATWSVTRAAAGVVTAHPTPFTLIPAALVSGRPTRAKVPADPGTVTLTYTVTDPETLTVTTPTTLTYTTATTPAPGTIARQALARYLARIDTTATPGLYTAQWATTGVAATVSDPITFAVT